MEKDRRVPVKHISKHELLITSSGREGISTREGGLDYTLDGQAYISGRPRKEIVFGTLIEGQDLNLKPQQEEEGPLGY